MDDLDIVYRIGELAAKEHTLERSHAGQALSGAEVERLRAVELTLDQSWDLLRQRRARRYAGEDAKDAAVRPDGVVESYQQ